MKFGKRDKSIVDALFLLALFGVFLICALFIVLFGAKIYKNTVKSSNESFIERTCYTYITEKIRQNDNSNGVSIESSDIGSIVKLTNSANGYVYITYLYCDNGHLKELTTTESNGFNKDAGMEIIELDSLSAKKCSDNLYYFTLSGENINTSFYVSVTSDITGGGKNE